MQEKKPKVSVCVVTYNQEKYIRQCLQSLVDQETDFDFEVIVADDFSTDGTRRIVREFTKKYSGQIKAIFHDENIGAYKNFIYVHQQAIGKYVSHIDGDDYALPGKLQAQAAVLDSKLGCTAVWHRVDYFNDAGDFCSGKTSDLSIFDSGRVDFADAIRLGFIGVHSSLMYRRSVRESVSFDRELLDVYFTWDLLSKGSGYILDEVFGRYRIAASGSLTVSSSSKISRLAIKHAEHFLRKYPKQRKNFIIWAITNAIFDVRHVRLTVFNFISFALRNFSIVSPREIFLNLINIRKIQVRWSRRDGLKVKEI